MEQKFIGGFVVRFYSHNSQVILKNMSNDLGGCQLPPWSEGRCQLPPWSEGQQGRSSNSRP